MWYSTSSGSIELQITRQQAHIGHHQGACDDDVADLAKVPAVKRQLAKIDPELLREELREYGAWDTEELADHAQNLQRILWIACGDICDRHV